MPPLEQEIAQVILAHPEYHHVIENPEQYHDLGFFPELGETNPFLHMGLHLAVREQIKTNRPQGIAEIYNSMVTQFTNPLDIEHLIMDQLAEFLWLAQKNNTLPDDQEYLNKIRQHTSGKNT